MKCLMLEREEFLRGASLYGLDENASESLEALYRQLVEVVRHAWADFHRDESPQHRVERTHAYLDAINRNIQVITTTSAENLLSYNAFSDTLRAAVNRDTSYIEPPNFDDRKKVPIDQLYVAPSFVRDIDEEPTWSQPGLPLSIFIENINRTVLLGDPGGGKSTLARKLACEASLGRRSVSGSCPEPVTPFIVILRDYGLFREQHDGSISDYIASRCRSYYQLSVPDGSSIGSSPPAGLSLFSRAR